jgi:hypothetical protein
MYSTLRPIPCVCNEARPWNSTHTNGGFGSGFDACRLKVVASSLCESVAAAEEFLAWEESQDIAAADTALAEALTKGTVSLAEIKAKYGL